MISGVCGSLAYLQTMIRKVSLNHSLCKMLPHSLTQVPKDAVLPAQGYWAASGFFVMEGSVHFHQCDDWLCSIMGGTSGVAVSSGSVGRQ